MERKALAVELKAEQEGAFRATFATFDVIDKDGDVTKSGAFKSGSPVRISAWGHDWNAPVIGRGTIGADETAAWVEAQFNLKMSAGRDTYESVKFSGDLQEFSYGYDVVSSEPGEWDGRPVRILKALEVHEVSPVLLGAGIGTGTDRIKSASFADHAEYVLADVQAFIDRSKSLADLRAKEGRTLSTANRSRINALLEHIDNVSGDLRKLLEDTDPKREEAEKAALLAIRLSVLRDEARALGVAA